MMDATDNGLGYSIASFPRILAVDAEPDMRTILEHGLGSLGFEVKVVTNGFAAASAIKEWCPEGILLDRHLPGIDAAALIASLRRVTDVPILVVCGDCETRDKLLALSLGADDIIAKPFDMEEVAAFIRARLRRPHIETREIVNYADITIDVNQRKVGRAGNRIELSGREFDLLLTLARHPESVFTREQLLDRVWGIDSDVTLATVETYISYLRSKIDTADGPDLIHTIRGVGYTMRAGRG